MNKKFLAVDGQIYSTNPDNPSVVEAGDIFDDVLQKTQAEINADVENTQSSIVALEELKQNKLIAGSNITILGNVISAIAGGDRSETPIALYKWSETSLNSPTISADDYVDGVNLDGWTTIVTSKIPNAYLWMTLNTLIYSEESYSLKSDWSTPIQISGDKGDTGDKGDQGDKGDKGDTGPQGPQGEKGDPGEDATNREFIYKRLTEHPFNGTNPALIKKDTGNIERTDEYIASTDDFVPYGWSDTALPATEAEKYVYVSIRVKPAGNNQTWGTFSNPILWSNWGHQGIDGDGVQYVYKLFNKELNSDERRDNKPLKPNSPNANGEYIPNGWSDDPLAPTPEYKFCYCAVLKKINGEWLNSFGELGLWSKWASDGSSVMARYSASGAENTWHSPFEIGDVWMLTSSDNGNTWTTPMRIIGEKGDETDFQFGISRLLVAEGAPDDITTWSNTPIATTSNKPYLWAKIITPDNVVSYVRLTGELGKLGNPGESAIFADLTNEMDSIACDSNGYVTSELSVETYVGIYKGSTGQSLKSITCKLGDVSLDSSYTDNGNITDNYKVTTNTSNGYVKVTVKEGTLITSRTDIFLTLVSTIDRVDITRELTLTINGVRGGANGSPAIIYSLVPSTTKIVKKKNGSFIPNGNITCQINKTQGTSVPEIVLADLTTIKFFKKVNNGSEEAYSATASDTITSGIEFYLYINDGTNDILVDKESIPLIEDGTDGVSNVWTIGEDGYWYLNGNKTNHLAEGRNGTGIELEGTVDYIFNSELPNPNTDNKTSLEGLSNLTVGDCYLVCDNGWLYFYDGETPENTTNTILNNGKPANPLGWRPVGEIKGEPGDPGTTYYYHIAWATSITYDSVSGELSSCTGFTTDKGNVDYPWMGICVDTVYDDPGSLNRIILDESDNDISYKSYKWNNVEGIQGPPGENGDTPVAIYTWREKSTVLINSRPSLTALSYVNGELPYNWYKTAPNRSEGYDGYHLWMSQNVLHIASDGTPSWKDNAAWSVPVRISGDTGTPGEDGDTREWIYSYDNSILPSNIDEDFEGNITSKNQPDWVPAGCTDNPQGVSSLNKTEYAAYRDITHNGTTVTYSEFSDWIVWSHYGERGIDGDGIEYVFIRTTKLNPPTVCTEPQQYSESNNDYALDEHCPYVYVTGLEGEDPIKGDGTTIVIDNTTYIAKCTDEPLGVDVLWKYEWVLTRNKTGGNQKLWQKYSGQMALWSNWGEKGEKGDPGKSIVGVGEYYLASKLSSGVTWTNPTNENSSTGEWIYNSIPEINSTYKYLWNYEKIIYSEGDPNFAITNPAIIGVYGNDGRSIQQVIEYYLATPNNSGVTTDRNTYNWTTEVQFVDSTNKYLWNYERIVYSSGDPSYEETNPVIIGVYGDKGDSVTIDNNKSYVGYRLSSNGTTPPEDGTKWDLTIPSEFPSVSKPFLWTKIVVTYVDGTGTETPVTSYAVSKSGFNGFSAEAEYSPINNPEEGSNNIHTSFQVGDKWMRTKIGNTYGNWIKIVGEKGEGGDYIDYAFAISNYPSSGGIHIMPKDTPGGTEYEGEEEDWNDAPIATTDQIPYLWMRMIQHTYTNGEDTETGDPSYIRLTPLDAVSYHFTCDYSKIIIPSGSNSITINTTFYLWCQVADREPTVEAFYIYPYFKTTSGMFGFIPTSSSSKTSSLTLENYIVQDTISCIGVLAYYNLPSSNLVAQDLLLESVDLKYLAKLEIPIEKEALTREDLEAQTIVIGLGGEGYGKIELNDLGQVVIDASLLVVRAPGGTIDGKQIITADRTTGKIDSLYLPSSLDDVIELVAISPTNPSSCQINTNYYNTVDKCIYYAYRPTGGSPLWRKGESPEKGKIYVDVSTNTIYRWSGSILVEISSGSGGGSGGNATSVGGYKILVLYPGQWHPETAASDTIYYILESSDNMVEIPEDIELDYLIGWEGYTPVTQQGWEFVVEPLTCVNAGTYYYEIALTGLDTMWNDGTVENHYLTIVVNPQVITSPASTKQLLYTGQTHNISELYTPPYGLSMSYNVESPANADLRDVGTYTVRLNTNNNNVVFENNQSYIDIEVTIDEITTWTFGDVFPIILNSN